jgi:hypothetical protein
LLHTQAMRAAAVANKSIHLPKQIYITTDMVREAAEISFPWVSMQDPVGSATERCFALWNHYADDAVSSHSRSY